MDQETYDRILTQRLSEQLLEARRQALAEQTVGPHSLEHVGLVNGVAYVNDSRSTFLDASLNALVSVEGPVLWIAGAWPAELDRGPVQAFLKEKVVALILFGPGGERPMDAVRSFTDQLFHAEEVRTAVFLAHELAREGQVVLFSPACPSGEGFANYEERGAEFKRAVRDL
jgi:UDP-N-acetylmuramoylalanine--D-glutamate ligase